MNPKYRGEIMSERRSSDLKERRCVVMIQKKRVIAVDGDDGVDGSPKRRP
jgi:hypothetical protein